MISQDIVIRLGLTIILILAGSGFWILTNRLILRRAKQNIPMLGNRGVPMILYFTTPSCAPCKTYQRPALEQVKQELGNRLQIVEVDASMQPDVASQWGVLSVPTTFILDANGEPRHINHGPTSAARLLKQLSIFG